MSRALSGLGKGAGAGAGIGATIGSFGGPIGTGIGAGIGAIGGGIAGFVSGSNADDEADKAKQESIEELQAKAQKTRNDAYQRYMLGYAARSGANPELIANQEYQLGIDDINGQEADQRKKLEASGDEGFDPMAFVPVANAAASVGNRIYNQASAPTPIDPQSPEAQQTLDNDNYTSWAPTRRGTRVGFGGATY